MDLPVFWDQQRDETVLYRYYDYRRDLLYVGITNDAYQRFMQHSLNAPWFLDAWVFTVEVFAHLAEAQAAELAAIRTEQPRWNGIGSRHWELFDGVEPGEHRGRRWRHRSALRHQVICGTCQARLVRSALADAG